MLKDAEIREPLFDFLEEQYGTIRILEEKNIGKSRADVMMVTEDALYGIEIKSDADTYARLAGQVKDYNRFCDFNYVVVGTSHALHIAEHVPDWWGIITVELEEDRVDFYVMRKPQRNPGVSMKQKLSLLWRPELAHIQERQSMFKYKEKSKLFVQKKILEKVDEDVLQKEILHELMERDYTLIEEEIASYQKQKRRKGR